MIAGMAVQIAGITLPGPTEVLGEALGTARSVAGWGARTAEVVDALAERADSLVARVDAVAGAAEQTVLAASAVAGEAAGVVSRAVAVTDSASVVVTGAGKITESAASVVGQAAA